MRMVLVIYRNQIKKENRHPYMKIFEMKRENEMLNERFEHHPTTRRRI